MTALCALALAGVAFTARAEPRRINSIRAIVNDKIITEQELMEAIAFQLDALAQTMSRQGATRQAFEQRAAEIERAGLEALIERKLILHDFKTAGYSLPESVIEDTIQQRIREQFGKRVTLIETLRAKGTTYESYREQVRETIIVDALRIRNVSSSIIISPYKIQKYYEEHQDKYLREEQVRLRMIVLEQPAGSPEGAAQKIAKEILFKLNEGVPFAEMAKIYSGGSQPGEVSVWKRDQLRDELRDVAFSLKPGERSGVIVTKEACYLLMLDEKLAAGPRPLSDVRDEIEGNLIAEERARLHQKYIDRLRAKSFVRYF